MNSRILTCIFFLVISGCETIVEVDVPFDGNRLVVNSFITPDSLLKAEVSLNKYILDDGDDYEFVRDAFVVVSDESGVLDTLNRLSGGSYQSDSRKIQSGKSYSLTVEAPGLPAVKASSSIPQPAQITKVEVTDVTDDHSTAVKINLSLKDDASQENYYHILLNVEFEYLHPLEYDIHRTSLFQPINIDKIGNSPFDDDNDSYDNGVLITDLLFNGQETELSLRVDNFSFYSSFSRMTLIVRSVSEEYYRYKTTTGLQDEVSNSPLTQPFNAYNNIEHGFGIFAGFSQSVHITELPGPEIFEVFPTEGKPGEVVTIKGNFPEVSPYSVLNVNFKSENLYGDPLSANAPILEHSTNEMKVEIPTGAITGPIYIYTNGKIARSPIEFVVLE